MTTKKAHSVQVSVDGRRYTAAELNGNLTLSRDGDVVGTATWKKEQLILSSAVLPDEACEQLEKKLKEAFDANWWED
jgi:hypothetical protein